MYHKKLVRTSVVLHRLGISRPTLLNYLHKDKTFPRPYNFNEHYKKWDWYAIERWLLKKQTIGEYESRLAKGGKWPDLEKRHPKWSESSKK